MNTGNVSVVKLLISAGAKLDAWNPECEGATPLHLAIMSGKCLAFEIQQIETLQPHFPPSPYPLLIMKFAQNNLLYFINQGLPRIEPQVTSINILFPIYCLHTRKSKRG